MEYFTLSRIELQMTGTPSPSGLQPSGFIGVHIRQTTRVHGIAITYTA